MKISWRKVSLWLLPIAIIGFFAARPVHSRPTADIDQPINAPESMDIRGVYLLNPHVPLPSTNFEIDPSREFVKPRTSSPLGSQQSRTNAIGQIDNSNPVKRTNNSNLKPEFQNKMV
jgi:hypothetical protein